MPRRPRNRSNRRHGRRTQQIVPPPSPPRSIVDSDIESLSGTSSIIEDYVSNLQQHAEHTSSSESTPEFSSPAAPHETDHVLDPDNIDGIALSIYEACQLNKENYQCAPASSRVRLALHRITELLEATSKSSGDEPYRFVEIFLSNASLPDRDVYLKEVREIAIELGLRRKYPKNRRGSSGKKMSSSRELKKLEKLAKRYIEQMVREHIINREQARNALDTLDWEHEHKEISLLSYPMQRQRQYIRNKVLNLVRQDHPEDLIYSDTGSQDEIDQISRPSSSQTRHKKRSNRRDYKSRDHDNNAALTNMPIPEQKPLGADNWGFGMLRRMGWTEGEGLGADKSGMVEPIQATRRINRGGLG